MNFTENERQIMRDKQIVYALDKIDKNIEHISAILDKMGQLLCELLDDKEQIEAWLKEEV